MTILISTSPLLAKEEIAYNQYSRAMRFPEAHQLDAAKSRDTKRIFARLLEQPFRPVRHFIGETAGFVERKHIHKKVEWFIDELALHGIYPKLRSPTEGSLGTRGLGGTINVGKLLKHGRPDYSLEIFGGWTPSVGFDGTDVEIGTTYRIQIPDQLVYHSGTFRYARSSSESFYGIGNKTSLGEWSTYHPEEIWYEASLGADLSRTLKAEGAFVYQKMNIGNGNRQGVGKIKEHFEGLPVPGVNGGDLIGLKSELRYDTRDNTKDPKQGGYGGVEISYFHDAGGDDFQYVKVVGDTAHFFKIGNDRRVLAVRLKAEQNFELGGDDVPFFNQARLGGSDTSDGSELLRSYRYNRYFDEGMLVGNLEYRYSVYEYGNFQADAFGLFDIGEVFENLGDFEFGELNLSYGGGMNIKYRRNTILSLLVAHGSEGLEMGTNSKISF